MRADRADNLSVMMSSLADRTVARGAIPVIVFQAYSDATPNTPRPVRRIPSWCRVGALPLRLYIGPPPDDIVDLDNKFVNRDVAPCGIAPARSGPEGPHKTHGQCSLAGAAWPERGRCPKLKI
jgi:hypothetical protein